MTEIFELFELYHKIQKSDVMDIFRHFPYLFCCDSVKMRILLAQFRKYRFTNQQILELVSIWLTFLTFYVVQEIKWYFSK